MGKVKTFIDKYGSKWSVGPSGFIPRSAWRLMRKRKETPGTKPKPKKTKEKVEVNDNQKSSSE